MNTILHQKRNVNFFITMGLTMALVIVAVFAIAASATTTKNVAPSVPQIIIGNKDNVAIVPLSADAFPQYRQSEWNSIAVTNNNGLETYHQSERTMIPAQTGWLAYYLSERNLVNPFAEYLASERALTPIVNAAFSLYHLSERAMIEAIAIPDLSQYVESERTLVDPLAGWAIYLESERTSKPIRFNKFQLSEWFGQ